MTGAVPWPAVGALFAGVVSLYFIRYLRPYREKLGARFFAATIGCEALWALSYGVALLVFDPGLRRALEVPIWIGINFIGVFFLAFALEYTGRGHLVRSWPMAAVVAVQAVHTLVVATHPWHDIAWTGYRIEPVLGAAAVTYTHQPWLFVNAIGIVGLVATGSFLLLDTFVSYGPLYRAQAAAIAVSPVLPGVAFLAWLFEVGGTPLHLTPLTFPAHLALDMYAFFRRDMFESTPAARRAAERAAIEDLGSAIVVVDREERIIDCNEEARRILGADGTALLGRPIRAVVESVECGIEEGTVPIRTGGERREYAVTVSALESTGGDTVGNTVVFQDITAEKRREQRLAVLNRVLRHNLRNDLNVVKGTIGVAADRADDEGVRDALATADETAGELLELGEKARTIERVLEGDPSTAEPVVLSPLVETVRDDLLADRPEACFESGVPEGLRVAAPRRLLRAVLENLVENAVEHNDAAEPRVEVAATGPVDGVVTVEVRDNGPGIPDHEREAIEGGDETALEHGSGLGLWLVAWGVTAVGGELRFDTDGGGTTATLDLPGVSGEDRPVPEE